MDLEPVRPPQIGEVIEGKYEIVRQIGKGGMAVVYEARSLSLQRSVALKFLHADMAENAKLVERFHREARNAAAITHPCVTYVFDVGWNDARTLPYMAMELLEGQSLAAELRKSGALSVQRAVHIGSRVLDALEAAHRLGVVHRDLKPENIFLSRQGTQENVKVLDFGISKVLGASGSDTLTKTGTVLGTPAYMSPEQVRSAKDVDHRADLYALGTVLYEMLAGRPAYEGETFTEIVYKILTEEPPPLLSLRPGLDASVVDVVQRALHKEPTRRWQSAESMRGALQDVVVDTSPGEAKPTPLAWELPSPEELSSAQTVAARRAWELQREVGRGSERATVAAKPRETGRVAASDARAPARSASGLRPAVPVAAAPARGSTEVPSPATPGTLTSGPTRRVDTAPVVLPATPPAATLPPTTLAAPASTGRLFWLGLPLVALVGALTAGGALWLRGRGEDAPTAPPPAPVAATAPLLPPLPPRAPVPPAATTPPPVAAPSCRVRVVVTTPGATVVLDGTSYPGNVDLPAACGTHHATHVEAPGHLPQDLEVEATVAPGPPMTLAEAPPAPPAPPPPPQAAPDAPARPRPAAPRPRPAAPDVNLETNPF